jgi:CRISPR-associated protein Cmr2
MTDYEKKIVAWLHDPAEKALILLRDREGHERGTVSRLRSMLGVDGNTFDRRADWLASGADRPQWPRGEGFNAWEQVDFARDAELVHPLSGARISVPWVLAGLDTGDIKARSQAHFESLIVDGNARWTFLNFWRFGPELARVDRELGTLWQMQPADTRVPDHSIWNHVDLVSAIHTALAGDADGPDQPALLAVSLGPVQGFISQARSTSDLWAGSHLLSSLVWEALSAVVSELGPDSVVFPALRGVPAVDRWLIEQDEAQGGVAGLRRRFEEMRAEILSRKDDTNPLFAAALPNKFVAIVPARQAGKLAEAAVSAARAKARLWAEEAAARVFEDEGGLNEITLAQLDAQLSGFPEAAWASAVWPVPEVERFRDPAAIEQAATRVRQALEVFHPSLSGVGVFDSGIWSILCNELKLDGIRFWGPGVGLLYAPAFELAERTLASAKAARPFFSVPQAGHRCTLTGEAEWLTRDRRELDMSRTDRAKATVWSRRAGRFGIRRGEHLGALATLKRLWPTLVADSVSRFLGLEDGEKVNRYSVSTHALALSTSMERWISAGDIDEARLAELEALTGTTGDSAALPRRVLRLIDERRLTGDLGRRARQALKRLPSIAEARGDDDGDDAEERRRQFDGQLTALLGTRPETYYALIQMDGDRMGGWLAGNEDEFRLRYRDTWHSRVRAGVASVEQREPRLQAYLDALRPSSPGRHVAISQALNNFSTHLARYIVEECCKGKLLYAGGDDVLALVAVDDLFDCMLLLRLAYSGIAPDAAMGLRADSVRSLGSGDGTPDGGRQGPGLALQHGFAYLRSKAGDGQLMTMMGHKATASMGAVVAHHTQPLGAVLRELRAAERRAKQAGRDAFCLRVLKRGGGEVSVTSPWWKKDAALGGQPSTAEATLVLMRRLTQALAGTEFSRGAIYRAQLWFAGLTDGPAGDAGAMEVWRKRVAEALAFQFMRQNGSAQLARDIVAHVCDVIAPPRPLKVIEDLLVTSEFFAREARSFRLEVGGGAHTGASAQAVTGSEA